MSQNHLATFHILTHHDFCCWPRPLAQKEPVLKSLSKVRLPPWPQLPLTCMYSKPNSYCIPRYHFLAWSSTFALLHLLDLSPFFKNTPLEKLEFEQFDWLTGFTERMKKKRGSTNTARRQEIRKNLFHCCTLLVWGFMTPGKFAKPQAYASENNLFNLSEKLAFTWDEHKLNIRAPLYKIE